MRKVCTDVETEPSLQPINGENVAGLTSDEAKPDVRTRGVWRPGQNVCFFYIRVTNTNSDSQVHLSPDKIVDVDLTDFRPSRRKSITSIYLES